MNSRKRSHKPDETDSKALHHPIEASEQPLAEDETPKVGEGEATESRLPGDPKIEAPIPSTEELILEREADGRYRIVGHRKHKKIG